MCGATRYVRFGPKADTRALQNLGGKIIVISANFTPAGAAKRAVSGFAGGALELSQK